MPGPQLDEPVALVPPDPSWPEWFHLERDRLLAALPAAFPLEHVGSTAVPGLAAKPIIDMLLGLDPAGDVDKVLAALVSLGYEVLGEAGVPGRLYLRRRHPAGSFNLHLMAPDGPLWRDNLLFRDHLRAHPAEARAYEAAKRAAAAAAPESLLAYSEAKRAVLGAILARGRQGPRFDAVTPAEA